MLLGATSRVIATAIVTLAALLALAAAAPAANAATVTGLAFKDLDRDATWQTSEPVLHEPGDLPPDAGRAVRDPRHHRRRSAATRSPPSRTAATAWHYRTSHWWALRDDWVPTTTALDLPDKSVSVDRHDDGRLRLAPDRAVDRPQRTHHEPTRDPAACASQATTMSSRPARSTTPSRRALIGAEAPHVTIRFDFYPGGTRRPSSASEAATDRTTLQLHVVRELHLVAGGRRPDAVPRVRPLVEPLLRLHGPAGSIARGVLQARGLAGDPRAGRHVRVGADAR